MTKRRRLKRAAGIGMVLAFMSLPLVSGCTVMASQEQLRMLEEARKAAESAEADLNACRQQKAELERQMANQKQKLADVQNTRSTVQKALGQ